MLGESTNVFSSFFVMATPRLGLVASRDEVEGAHSGIKKASKSQE